MAKKKAGRAAAPTQAVRVLVEAKVPHELRSFDAGSDHFGQHAAEALAEEGVVPEQIFKTLVVDAGKKKLAVCCVPVSARLSLKKAAQAWGVPKVTMADPADAQRSSGYIPGGISPLGQKNPLPTFVDASARDFPMIFVSGGRRGLDIALAADDLLRLCQGEFADLQAQ